jgi:hypothetical protein
MLKMENILYKVKESLKETVYAKLGDELYDNQIYNLGINQITEDAIETYLMDLLENEKAKQKMVNAISKQILQKNKDKLVKQKIELAKSTKLWNITKGKIPCLCECGYVDTKTENEVLYESNNFICASCCKELEKDDDHSATTKVFQTKNIYSIFNIK